MAKFIIVSIVGGLLFGTMDAIINANPHARKLFAAYKPIARERINAPAGIVIDLLYGFVLAGLFLLLFDSLPGSAGVVKGLSFAAIVWFLRVVMSAASNWMMFRVPLKAVAYTLVTGLVEMAVLGVLYGAAL